MLAEWPTTQVLVAVRLSQGTSVLLWVHVPAKLLPHLRGHLAVVSYRGLRGLRLDGEDLARFCSPVDPSGVVHVCPRFILPGVAVPVDEDVHWAPEEMKDVVDAVNKVGRHADEPRQMVVHLVKDQATLGAVRFGRHMTDDVQDIIRQHVWVSPGHPFPTCLVQERAGRRRGIGHKDAPGLKPKLGAGSGCNENHQVVTNGETIESKGATLCNATPLHLLEGGCQACPCVLRQLLHRIGENLAFSCARARQLVVADLAPRRGLHDKVGEEAGETVYEGGEAEHAGTRGAVLRHDYELRIDAVGQRLVKRGQAWVQAPRDWGRNPLTTVHGLGYW
mmetsp:Transcript_5681/g.13309  ORF Transcript_5681/g.13309 Transcript_5681/m.13309 type:complete len:334 (+) Transcript_5681:209-1210(+)